MMTGGIALTCLGAVSILAGALYGMSLELTNSPPAKDVVMGMTIGGLVGLGAGIPLIVIGGKRVPVHEPPSSASAVSVLVGPGRLTFQGQFH
ncbi:uncharacterized protein CMC5_077280 [Chondromyces crocatus]|uniref:Uncharacterized protein n=2 Tax=Chondromyces crocatus TaxID=52 RepID=A0A0K1ERM5_CHOCO|nr:uncharacterized protein CMC5_077280 [Chondromyces crocatus]